MSRPRIYHPHIEATLIICTRLCQEPVFQNALWRCYDRKQLPIAMSSFCWKNFCLPENRLLSNRCPIIPWWHQPSRWTARNSVLSLWSLSLITCTASLTGTLVKRPTWNQTRVSELRRFTDCNDHMKCSVFSTKDLWTRWLSILWRNPAMT